MHTHSLATCPVQGWSLLPSELPQCIELLPCDRLVGYLSLQAFKWAYLMIKYVLNVCGCINVSPVLFIIIILSHRPLCWNLCQVARATLPHYELHFYSFCTFIFLTVALMWI